jgi:hypothetical protein
MRPAPAGKQGKPGQRPRLADCSTVITSELNVLFLFIKSKLEGILKTHD